MPGPTNLEQLELELINDARLDPLGDAARYITSYTPLTSSNSDIQGALTFFGVDGAALQAAFAALTPVQPLAWNENLATAARGHNGMMIAGDEQSHQVTSQGEHDFPTRLTDAGYAVNGGGENVFAFANSALHAQAGFMVDWGGSGATGMQDPPGHRNNIMNATFREIGVGVTAESNGATDVGPLVMTEDFGNRNALNDHALILGVAYNDTDHDDFYSVGEGLATLTVSITGGGSTASSASGGYVLDSATTGQKTITFSGAGLASDLTVISTLAASSNYKFDIVDGNELRTSNSAIVTGPVTIIRGLGIVGLTLAGADGVARSIIGTKGGDTLIGGSAADVLNGGLGNDTLTGAAGVDRVVLAGNRAAYTVTRAGLTTTVVGPDGTDTVNSVELLAFDDVTLSLPAARNDFNCDGFSDILWQNNNGQAAIWTFNGFTQTGGSTVGGNPGTSWHAKGAGDFDGDGKADILWQNDDGSVAIWTMNGVNQIAGGIVGGNPGPTWNVITAADFNGDGKSDILWQNDDGQAAIWTFDGFNQTGGSTVGGNPGADWHVKDAADFNGDGKADILWQNDNGQAAIWTMDGLTQLGGSTVGGNPGTSWHVKSGGDFNGDGKADILWQNDNSQAAIWTMDGFEQTGGSEVGGNPGTDWHIKGAGDFSGDGKADILWQNDSGQPALWTFNGLAQTGGSLIGGNPGADWHVIAMGA